MSDKYSAPNIRNIGAKDKAECLKINMENRIRDLGVGCDLICLGEAGFHDQCKFVVGQPMRTSDFKYSKYLFG